MAFSKSTWDQLKAITASKLIAALLRDGWTEEESRGATRGFFKAGTKRRAVVHYHPKKTFGAGLLKSLIDDIGWTVDDLKRLKLIK